MALPSGYKRLEYIESSGTQYIDEGFKPNQDTRVVCDVDWAPASTASWLFGCRTSNTAETYNFLTYSNKYRSDYNATTSGAETSSTPSGRFIIDKDKNITKIDGVVVNTLTYASFQCKYNMYLFANNNAGSVAGNTSAKLYSCQVYDNGTLVRDYIPCQTTSGEVGLYDLVNSAFYGNAGTGTFTAGPEVGVATPENFRLSSSTETTAMLAWSAVDLATGYKLYRDGILIATLTDTSYTDTIQPFTSYLYTLTAYNDSGESDPATISVQVIIPPEAPSNFRASSASMTAISLAWDAVTGAESYQLSRDGAVIYTGEYPSYTDRGLTAETAYTYTLSAFNTAGSSAETTLEVATTQLILVTDRTAADVAAQNAKGTYNAADLNRVGEAMNYVAARLREQGYDPHISPKTDWKDDDWVDPAAQAVYLGDLAELRKQFTMLESTPEVPPRILATAINSGDGLTYVWANDIEQILVDIDTLLTNIAAGWLYSGEIYSGEV